MTYVLYDGGNWLGPLATISGWGAIIEAVDAFNRGGGRGRIPALAVLVKSGISDDPRQVAKDITCCWRKRNASTKTLLQR
jgi:hypothetical protein